ATRSTPSSTLKSSPAPPLLAATLSPNQPTITSDTHSAAPTGITNDSAQAPMPCLNGDSISSLSCQDSSHYYCNVTDHICYARLSDSSPCQDNSVCNINSICSGNVCVPSANSSADSSSPDVGKIAMIAGPILGALLIAALLLCFCCMRRKKRREDADSTHNNAYPFAARPNSFSSSAPPPITPLPLMHSNHNIEHTNSHSLSPEMAAIAAGAVNRSHPHEESNNRLGNQNSTMAFTQSYLSCPTSTSSSPTPPDENEQTTDDIRLSKFMLISNVLNSGNSLRDSSSLSKDDQSTGSHTPKGPFMLGSEISSQMNSPTLPLEDLTDRGSTQSFFTSSNRDSDVLPTMDQDEFKNSPESVYLGLEFTSPEAKTTNKGRYTMGSMYSMYSTYSTDYSNLPNSPSFNILRGVQSSVSASKNNHSRIRNDSFSTITTTTQTISNTYDDSRSSFIQLNAPIFNNNGNNGLSLTPTREYSDSTYSTASSLNSTSMNSNSGSDHTLTPKNMYSTNRNDGQT
ncbi:336_t:CDS:1, partial [Racocetra fulgida]